MGEYDGDPIRNAIDSGGGQSCDVEGVMRALNSAGFVIVPREPTRAMMADAWDEHTFDRREVWQSMIAAQAPIEVQCKCGWRGSSAALIGRLASNDAHCPKCGAVFTAWPKHPIEQS